MIQTDNLIIETLCRDLTGSRKRLLELLLDNCAKGRGVAHSFPCVSSRRIERGAKYLFAISDEHLAEQVRNLSGQLLQLRGQIESLAGDLHREQGLWLPALIDAAAGDTQVNLMVHTSRHSREIPTTELSTLMISDDYEALRPHLESLNRRFPTVRLARDAGKAYRLTVRGHGRHTAATGGKTGEKSYEVIGLNGFAVVLGDVQVVLPVVGRFRATRRDSVYSAPPLLEFSGRRDRPWKVYPPD
jgi:hypothetical protein